MTFAVLTFVSTPNVLPLVWYIFTAMQRLLPIVRSKLFVSCAGAWKPQIGMRVTLSYSVPGTSPVCIPDIEALRNRKVQEGDRKSQEAAARPIPE
jgi:hypothetical protein